VYVPLVRSQRVVEVEVCVVASSRKRVRTRRGVVIPVRLKRTMAIRARECCFEFRVRKRVEASAEFCSASGNNGGVAGDSGVETHEPRENTATGIVWRICRQSAPAYCRPGESQRLCCQVFLLLSFLLPRVEQMQGAANARWIVPVVHAFHCLRRARQKVRALQRRIGKGRAVPDEGICGAIGAYSTVGECRRFDHARAQRQRECQTAELNAAVLHHGRERNKKRTQGGKRQPPFTLQRQLCRRCLLQRAPFRRARQGVLREAFSRPARCLCISAGSSNNKRRGK